MHLPILSCQWHKGRNLDFIKYWATVYQDVETNNHDYDRLIRREHYFPADIRTLFDWKNGMAINDHHTKLVSVNRIIENLKIVNSLKTRFDRAEFDTTFGKMSAIWQIFLLHLIDPKRFPIFDQHVYRAEMFLTQRRIVEQMPGTLKQKLNHYHQVYIPFFDNFRPPRIPGRRVDNALWTFGRFLKTEYGLPLTSQ